MRDRPINWLNCRVWSTGDVDIILITNFNKSILVLHLLIAHIYALLGDAVIYGKIKKCAKNQLGSLNSTTYFNWFNLF